MRQRARRKAPEKTEPAADPRQELARAATAVWIYDSAVCMQILDSPPTLPRDGVCRCEACHAALTADWAARFLP
ncbi:MAG TPA: hypothetical protein VFU13_17340 [Steroidobacteraceae bacterium]|nr:hypothetical protein [Steroidobacteraceae bacterium]